MAIDFKAFLDRKYDVLEQRTNTDSAIAQNLGMLAAQPIPSSGPAQPQKDTGSSVTGVTAPPAGGDVNFLDRARTTTGSLPTGSSGLLDFDLSGPKGLASYKKGTARVPGKGDGTKDTVKAKLAPGEAVLNKAAADGMGRGLISALNKMGAKKMGLV